MATGDPVVRRDGRRVCASVCAAVVIVLLISPAGFLEAKKRNSSSPDAAACGTTTVCGVAGTATEQTALWRDADIGTSKRSGASAQADGVFALAGSGVGVGGTRDSLHFMYQVMTGDVDVVAHVLDIGDGHPLAQTGVMIRGSLSSEASHASLIAIRKSGVRFERRLAQSWSTLDTSTGESAVGSWLRLERRGAVVSAFVSTNGSAWELVGSELVNLDAAAYVGVIVASHQPDVLVTAAVDNLSIRKVTSTPEQPTPTPSAGGDVEIPPAPVSEAPVPVIDPPAPTVPDNPVTVSPPDTSAAPPPATPPPATAPSESPAIETPAPPPTGSETGGSTPDPTPPASTSGSGWTSVDPVVPAPVTPPVTSPLVVPRYLAFTPSSDHDTNVDAYTLEIQLASNPGAAVVEVNLGKPPVTDGECRVDVASLLTGLPAGTYIALVTAVNGVGVSPPAASPFFSL